MLSLSLPETFAPGSARRESKKQDTKLLFISSQNIHRFLPRDARSAKLKNFTEWLTVSILLQRRIKTSQQNAVFAQSDGDRRRVEIWLHQCWYSSVWESRLMESYYYDLLLSQQLLPVIGLRHVSSELIFYKTVPQYNIIGHAMFSDINIVI